MTWGQNFYTRCAKDEWIAKPFCAALRAAIFLLSAKNRWGEHMCPPGRARVKVETQLTRGEIASRSAHCNTWHIFSSHFASLFRLSALKSPPSPLSVRCRIDCPLGFRGGGAIFNFSSPFGARRQRNTVCCWFHQPFPWQRMFFNVWIPMKI